MCSESWLCQCSHPNCDSALEFSKIPPLGMEERHKEVEASPPIVYESMDNLLCNQLNMKS